MQKEQQQLAALIKGKKVAFIGAGVSHKALIKEFVELGAHVTLCDQKKSVDDFGDYAATIRELGIDLSLGENYLEGFKGQDIIMRTPGFVGYFEKPLQDAMAAGTMVTSEVELFFDFCPCEIVGVTGSDGKTTTTTLISKFYEAAGRKVHLGGNIGAALLPMLPEVAPEDVAVVELSSFQLISMHKSPKIAVVTNVTPNHLDHHKDMQEYIDAKRNILIHQVPPCREVLGYENEITRGMQADCKGKQVWFTRLHETDNGAFLRDDGMLCMAEDGVVTPFLAQKDVKLRGLHNIENLLAAAAGKGGGGAQAISTPGAVEKVLVAGHGAGQGELGEKILVRLAQAEHKGGITTRLNAEGCLGQLACQHGGAVLNGGKFHRIGRSSIGPEHPPEREHEILGCDGVVGGCALGGGIGQAAL